MMLIEGNKGTEPVIEFCPFYVIYRLLHLKRHELKALLTKQCRLRTNP